MSPSSRQSAATPQPCPQGDGSPEPVYTVDLPELGVRVRVTVQRAPLSERADEGEGVETGYGHGV
jgi:hypothetical protein